MAGRTQDELKTVTLLGNQGTTYTYSYDPDILEVFDNKHPNNDYFVKFNCQNLQVFVQLLGNQTLQRFIFHTFREKKWWKVNR